jgi:hypothetical protein
MYWSDLRFGRYKGDNLPKVLFADPDWFFWAYDEEAFQGTQEREADIIYVRATNIRIPQPNGQKLVAEYMIHPSVGKFSGMELVPEDRPAHEGSTPTFRRNVIDLSIPRQISEYDKTGGKILIQSVKFHYFGNQSARMTKPRCEDFFNDPANFSRFS